MARSFGLLLPYVVSRTNAIPTFSTSNPAFLLALSVHQNRSRMLPLNSALAIPIEHIVQPQLGY